MPDDNTLDVGNTFSAEGWIKRSSTAQSHTMMVKGFQVTVMNAGSGWQVWLRKPNVSTVARSNAGVGAGAYHHIVVTKNGSGPGTVKIYIDGAPVTVVDVSAAQIIQNTAGVLAFGASASNQADFDEFALYDEVLYPSGSPRTTPPGSAEGADRRAGPARRRRGRRGGAGAAGAAPRGRGRPRPRYVHKSVSSGCYPTG